MILLRKYEFKKHFKENNAIDLDRTWLNSKAITKRGEDEKTQLMVEIQANPLISPIKYGLY